MSDSKQEDQQKEPLKVSFSVPQIAGGALAAATAAAVGSQLGVAGTVIGAAVASLVGGVAGTLYSVGIDRTHRRVAEVIAKTPSNGHTNTDQTRTLPQSEAEEQPTLLLDDSVFRDEAGGADPDPKKPRRGRRPIVVAVVTAAAIFVVALVTITFVELGLGRALDGGSGTTISQVVEQEEGKRTPSPKATKTPSPDKPKATESSSGSASPEPSESATSSPSASASQSTSPTPSTSTSAAPAPSAVSPTALPTAAA